MSQRTWVPLEEEDIPSTPTHRDSSNATLEQCPSELLVQSSPQRQGSLNTLQSNPSSSNSHTNLISAKLSSATHTRESSQQSWRQDAAAALGHQHHRHDVLPESQEEHIIPKEKTNRATTSFNIMKTIIGGGMFATPYALMRAGFGLGMMLIIVMGIVFYWSIMTLIHSATKAEKLSLQSLMRYCFRESGERLLNVVVFIIAWGSMASYTVIIGDVLPAVLKNEAVFGDPSNPTLQVILSRRFLVGVCSFCIILPVSMSRSLARLSKFSEVALIAIVIIIIILLGAAPTVPDTFKGNQSLPIPFFHQFSGILSSITVFAFAYTCQHNILLNYVSLKKKSANRFKGVALFSLSLTVIATVTIGCAYLTFREKTRSDLFMNYPNDMNVITISRLLFGKYACFILILAMDMFFTYPLELFVARDTIEKAFYAHKPVSNTRRRIITCALVLSTTIVGWTICDLGVLFEITGGMGSSIVAFIVPSACWLKVNAMKQTPLSTTSRILHMSSILFGCLVMFLTLAMVIYDKVNGLHYEKACQW